MAENFAVEIHNILETYNQEVQDAVEEAAKEAAELTAKTIKANSPKGKGKYRRGWRARKQRIAGLTGYVVFNGTQPALTHTLENGHIARNQYGTWGRVRAIKHIAPAAEAGVMRFELAVRARLRRLN